MCRNSVVILLLAILLWSCSRNGSSVDTSGIEVNLTIKRFEKDVFSIDPDSLHHEIPRLNAQYGGFFKLFGEGIIRIGPMTDPKFEGYLQSFLSDNMVNEGYQRVLKVFPDVENVEKALNGAFKRYRYYFPNGLIPEVYTYVSGYNLSIALADSLIGIGLDRYLGSNCEYYPQLGIPRYQIRNMHPAKIPSDCIRAWLIGEFPYNDSINNLLNNMVYEGRLMYMVKKLLPDEPDSLVFGFTSDQMRWCRSNEEQMWTHLIENKILFTTESFQINKMINDAPFTSGFPRESPGRAAVWLGYRIIDSFMRSNREVSIPQLMGIRDYQRILNLSKYRPG